ncbi:MAG: hypothetical protein Q9180_003883 [Flavoplaca navasiana]
MSWCSVIGSWASKQKYLSDHYALLREDGVAPLRNVVSELKANPDTLEPDSVEQSQIYEKVCVGPDGVDALLLRSGAGFHRRSDICPTRCCGKGNFLTTEDWKEDHLGAVQTVDSGNTCRSHTCRRHVPDNMQSRSGRSAATLRSTVQSSGDRYILRRSERYRDRSSAGVDNGRVFERLFRGVQTHTQEPPEDSFGNDMSAVFQSGSGTYTHVDILDGDWPNDATSNLDASQLAALRRILTKELAIVQGPPGTAMSIHKIHAPMASFSFTPIQSQAYIRYLGKTHVSVVALRVLLENKQDDDPPILVAAHTNHALDQLLRYIAPIESKFIRLGGMSTDYEIIKPRTLYEVKQATKLGIVPGGSKGPALGGMRALVKEMQGLLKPLTEGKPLDEEVLKEHKILTEDQCKSLLKGSEKWIDTSLPDSITAAIHKWAGEELVEANRRTQPEDYGFDYEEIDLEYEQLKELEAEGKVGGGGDDDETLRGERLSLSEPWTGREQLGRSKDNWDSLLKKTNDLWQVPPEGRGPLYRHMQQRLKDILVSKMRRLMVVYEKRVTELKIGKWEIDTNYLKEARVIGCTLTGISKYRALLHSLQPKIVLIEEAAETLEAQVTAACFDSLEHLILVGDHQQLRGQCNEKQLEGKPWYLDVSMFERLVRNNVGFSQLSRQRRMHPEIRRGLMPIYPNLEDHPSVALRPPVPGMGLLRSYFFSHDWPEDTDDLMSKVNRTEADMIVNFFNYLIINGAKTKDITVLTFYNGQRKLILSSLRKHANLQGEVFKVVTVDSYQGEENGIVLLSLVRSNLNKQIGFLSVANRVCVALSRAQQGFYIFGDAGLLSRQSRLWYKLIKAMSENPRRVGLVLPLTCQNHQSVTYAKDPDYFNSSFGGCEKACGGQLPCGHGCAIRCHPFSHTDVLCNEPCSRKLLCSHICEELCYAPCKCACERNGSSPSRLQTASMPLPAFPSNNDAYRSKNRSGPHDRISPTKAVHDSSSKRSSQSPIKEDYRFLRAHSPALMELTPEAQPFRDFADGGHVAADAAAASRAADAAAKERHSRLDAENHTALFGNSSGIDDLIDTSLTPRTNELKLAGTRQARDGTIRNTYEGSYSSPVATQTCKTQEFSLIDME